MSCFSRYLSYFPFRFYLHHRFLQEYVPEMKVAPQCAFSLPALASVCLFSKFEKFHDTTYYVRSRTTKTSVQMLSLKSDRFLTQIYY